MPDLVRAFANSLRSRFAAGLLAAAFVLSTSGPASARAAGAGAECRAVVAVLPVVHAPGLQHVGAVSRAPRSAWPRLDAPLAARASSSIAIARSPGELSPAPRCADAVGDARGYDATAPPVS